MFSMLTGHSHSVTLSHTFTHATLRVGGGGWQKEKSALKRMLSSFPQAG